MPSRTQRLLLVLPATSYNAEAFSEAAKRLGVELWLATDLPAAVERLGLPVLRIELGSPDAAALELLELAPAGGFDAVLGTDEQSALVSASVASRLGLPSSDPAGIAATANKRAMRELCASRGVPSPAFAVLEPNRDPLEIMGEISFPCVVKPPMLSGSQGVIRADDPKQLVDAVYRIRRLLQGHPSPARTAPDFECLLIERYLDGVEVAVEGYVHSGRLETIAIFDKPDELSGPYFEETLYVTPSRLDVAQRQSIVQVVALAARALGLENTPVHAEVRLGESGARLVEIAARSIGGLCSRALDGILGNLEERLIAKSLGLPAPAPERRSLAAGVMMIPIPKSGVLRRVNGVERARRVRGVEDVRITTKIGQALRTLPEGRSYLGFIFAAGDSPSEVERSLRQAHDCLDLTLSPLLS